MTTLSVMFLWHMHQPYYTDVVQGTSLMPWIRLHSTKGYLDMAQAVHESPGAKVVMNLTPCLVRQIREQVEGNIKDSFELTCEKPAADLTPAERAFVIHYFFMANWDTLVRPNPEYYRLLSKRGTRGGIDFDQVQKSFTVDEMRDLTVWFNLAWFGWRAMERSPELAELKRKGRGFSEDDKAFVLAEQKKIMAEILPFYRRLWEAGAIEVSTTPMFHPILPLLYDSALADRARPGVKLPARFRHPEDADEQVARGLEYMRDSLGKKPAGMWPSEGSVAQELVPILAAQGVRWIGTDEGILFKRIRSHRRDEDLFHPWKVVSESGELSVFFRDHGLSDLIGFTYARQDPEAAAGDLVRRLREIGSSVSRIGLEGACVPIILDGENPWEAYPDGGKAFLLALYRGIAEADGIEMTTASEYLDRCPPTRVLDQLPTGSWINNNFDIWIGGPEENKAWDYLGKVRDELPGLSAEAPAGVADAAWDSLYAAEGSDWFWWYGDFFNSELDAEFDYLFRTHLKNAYTLLGLEPPMFLNDSVIFEHAIRVLEEPMDLIEPVIDGRVTDYYEWRAAGHYDLSRQGAMHSSARRFDHIYYGFDMENFYLRLDFSQQADPDNDARVDVRVHVLSPRKMVIVFPMRSPVSASVYEETEDGELMPKSSLESVCRGKIIELKAPFEALSMKAGDEAQFVIELFEEDTQIERHPRDGFISFTVPDESFEARHWSV